MNAKFSKKVQGVTALDFVPLFVRKVGEKQDGTTTGSGKVLGRGVHPLFSKLTAILHKVYDLDKGEIGELFGVLETSKRIEKVGTLLYIPGEAPEKKAKASSTDTLFRDVIGK